MKLSKIIKKMRDLPLNWKIINLMFIFCIVYVSIIFMIYFFIFIPGLESLEKSKARDDINRVINAIRGEINQIDKYCYDNAAWDDMYSYADNHNGSFIKKNFPLNSLMDNMLNMVYVYDTAGNKIWGRAIDFKTRKDITIRDFHGKRVPLEHKLIWGSDQAKPLRNLSKTGIINTEIGFILVSSRPVITTKYVGPVRGSLIMGRILTQELISNIIKKTRVGFQIIPFKPDKFNNRTKERVSYLLKTAPYYFEYNDNINAYSLMADMYGKNAFIIKTDKPAKIIAEGSSFIRFAVISIIASMIIILLIMTLLLKKLSLIRLLT